MAARGERETGPEVSHGFVKSQGIQREMGERLGEQPAWNFNYCSNINTISKYDGGGSVTNIELSPVPMTAARERREMLRINGGQFSDTHQDRETLDCQVSKALRFPSEAHRTPGQPSRGPLEVRSRQ